MRRAIIHIGMPRTGSTSLQYVLTNLRPRLAREGIVYPDLTPPHRPEGSEGNHQPLGQALDKRRPKAERVARLARLDATLGRTDADVAILSYEDFAVQKPRFRVPDILRELFWRHGFAMEAAIVVKPQAEQLNSAYALRAQLVRETGSFRDFALLNERSARLDYRACAAPWRAAADGRLTAVPVRDARSGLPLLERILIALGLDSRIKPLADPRDLEVAVNRSSGPVAVEASRRLRAMRAHRQVHGHSRVIGHFLDEAAWSRGLDRDTFRGDAPDVLARLRDRLDRSNECFAQSAWGTSWDAVVAPAPARAANELAALPIDDEVDGQVGSLVGEAIRHFGFTRAPGWRRVPAELLERGAGRVAELTGYSRWRLP